MAIRVNKNKHEFHESHESCKSLRPLDLSTWKVNNLKYAQYMCWLTSLRLILTQKSRNSRDFASRYALVVGLAECTRPEAHTCDSDV